LPLIIVVVQLSPSVRLSARWPYPTRLPIVALVERLPSASPSALDGCLHPRFSSQTGQGAFSRNDSQGATGAVLRDVDGRFKGGRARWHPHGLDALMMEALACRDGIQLAREKGVLRIQVETDCQELTKLWKQGGSQRSHVASIISDAIELSSSFHGFTLLYTPRSCNHVAHVLAKQVTADDRLGEWQSAPACIEHLVTEDCNPAVP
jgi:ribonuclease HI